MGIKAGMCFMCRPTEMQMHWSVPAHWVRCRPMCLTNADNAGPTAARADGVTGA